MARRTGTPDHHRKRRRDGGRGGSVGGVTTPDLPAAWRRARRCQGRFAPPSAVAAARRTLQWSVRSCGGVGSFESGRQEEHVMSDLRIQGVILETIAMMRGELAAIERRDLDLARQMRRAAALCQIITKALPWLLQSD